MLILTRRVEERSFIGDEIVLSVLEIEGTRVKLGLEAPRNIAILREEIHKTYSGEALNDPVFETKKNNAA